MKQEIPNAWRSCGQRVWRCVSFVVCLMAILLAPSPKAVAQSEPIWSPVENIPGYDRNTLPPYLVADQYGRVHAFSSQPISETEAGVLIMYNYWTLERGWSEPNDILLPPYNNFAWVSAAYLDNAEIMHLVFFGGHERGANIYYTWAPLRDVGNATAWAKPKEIGLNAVVPPTASLASDGQGNMTVVYSANQGEGNSLYAVHSNDGGLTWSDSQIIYSTFSAYRWPVALEMYVDQADKLHAVWNVVDDRGANIGGFYMRLEELASNRWSKPMELAESIGLGVAVPSVIERNDELLIIYNNGRANEVAPVMWMRQSTDGGNTWGPPVQAFPSYRGRNGVVALVTDSANTLHALFGGRTGDNPIHGMWHSVWEAGRWSQPQPVISGPQRAGSTSLALYARSEPGFDPGDPRAVVVQGNILLVTWRTDPGLSKDGVWYSYRVLEAPPLPVASPDFVPVPNATLPPMPTRTPSARATALPTRTPTPAAVERLNEPPQSLDGPAASLLAGSAPVIMLVLTILVVHGVRQRSRR